MNISFFFRGQDNDFVISEWAVKMRPCKTHVAVEILLHSFTQSDEIYMVPVFKLTKNCLKLGISRLVDYKRQPPIIMEIKNQL